MIAKLKFFLFLSLAQFCVSYVSAQTNYTPLDLKSAPRYWVDTINAKYKQFTQLDNFLIYKQTSSLLNKNSEMPIMIQLFKGRMYHFLIFADPLTTKVEMKLGMRGVGHIITDKFYPMRDGAFYTEFRMYAQKMVFICLLFISGLPKRN